MAVETDADRLEMLDTDEFATTATFGQTSVPGIFDGQGVEVTVEGMEIATTAPTFLCRESDVSGLARGGTVVIGGTTYYVIEKRPDGTGMVTLILSKDGI